MNQKSFLGQGWAFPPAFTRELNSVIMSGEDQNIQESLRILFSTHPGERIMNLLYGTELRSAVFQESNIDIATMISEAVHEAILLYEPRIEVQEIQVSEDPGDDAILRILVSYTVIKTNSRQNFVYPFHFIEGTQINS